MKQKAILGLGLILLFGALICGPVRAQTNSPGTADQTIAAIGQSIVAKLAAGDFAGVTTSFNGYLKAQLTPPVLRGGWENLTAQFGAFKRMGAPVTGKTPDGLYDQVRINCEFERGSLTAFITFDGGRQVIGLLLQPPQTGGTAFNAKAKKIVELMAAGDFDAVYGQFNDQMKQGLPVPQLRSLWAQFVQTKGNFRRQLGDNHVRFNGFDQVNVRCEFEHGNVLVQVAFDAAQDVGGLYLVAEPGENAALAQNLLSEAQHLLLLNNAAAWQQAVDKFVPALAAFRALGDPLGQAYALGGLGAAYLNLGDLDKALDNFTASQPLFHAAGLSLFEAQGWLQIAGIYAQKGDSEPAIERYQQAKALFTAIRDAAANPADKQSARIGEAQVLGGLALVYTNQGDRDSALDHYRRALDILTEENEQQLIITTLNAMGSVYLSRGDLAQAVDYHTRALGLARSSKQLNLVVGALTNLGGDHSANGEKQQALDFYRQAEQLEVQPEVRDLLYPGQHAFTLMEIAVVEEYLWDTEAALKDFNQSLTEMRAANNERGENQVLTILATFYASLGDEINARRMLQQATALTGNTRDPAVRAANLSTQALSQDKATALASLNQALSLQRSLNDPAGQMNTLGSLCNLYLADHEYEKALNHCTEALTVIRKFNLRSSEPFALQALGRVQEALGKGDEAFGDYRAALDLLVKLNDRVGQVGVLLNLSVLERDRNELTAARDHVEKGLALIETLRGSVVSADQRASFFAMVVGNYQFYIDLLMRFHQQQPTAGHDAEAFAASERGRSRSLLELLSETRANIRQGVDPQLGDRERTLREQLDAKAQIQMKVLLGRHADAEAAAIAAQVDELATEFQQVEAELRQKNPNYAALTQPQPLTLKEIQTQLLDKDTVLLEYSVGPERSYLWVVAADSLKSYQLPKGDVVDTAVRRFYFLLDARNQHLPDETREQKAARVVAADAELPAASLALSKIILAPAAAQLGKKRLAIVADGLLQYIPFAALIDPATFADATPEPLIGQHEIVSLPSAATLAVVRQQVAGRTPAPKLIAALADPVFMKDDPRFRDAAKPANTGNGETAARAESVKDRQLLQDLEATGVSEELQVPRLLGSGEEATAIVGLSPAGASKLALGFDANRTLATSADLSQYRYIHFSTHGFLNPDHPELSGIVLSLINERGEAQDGFLRAHEIFNLKLPAELVVLSACQTGIGKSVRGEGLISLTRAFMYAGAPRVLVSLWSVSDGGTKELMVRFYQAMLAKGMSPAAALQAAQNELRTVDPWKSAYYWAPFTLQGEWR